MTSHDARFVSHLRSVHGDSRHVCKFCAKLFKLQGSLLVHQRVMHQPVNERVTNLLARRQEEPAVKQEVEGVEGVLLVPPVAQQEQEQEQGQEELEKGEIAPKEEVKEGGGGGLVCNTCNKVREGGRKKGKGEWEQMRKGLVYWPGYSQ